MQKDKPTGLPYTINEIKAQNLGKYFKCVDEKYDGFLLNLTQVIDISIIKDIKSPVMLNLLD